MMAHSIDANKGTLNKNVKISQAFFPHCVPTIQLFYVVEIFQLIRLSPFINPPTHATSSCHSTPKVFDCPTKELSKTAKNLPLSQTCSQGLKGQVHG